MARVLIPLPLHPFSKVLGELERQARDLIGAEVERLSTMLAQVRFYSIRVVLALSLSTHLCRRVLL